MSRLHEVKVKGLDNVEVLPILQTVNVRTCGDRLLQLTGDWSPRKGTRKRTAMKTAKALGFNATPTGSWDSRKQGESGKAWKLKHEKSLRNQARAAKKGDRV